MSKSIITINLVVLNGEKYIRRCLEAVFSQSYPHELIEFNILDNNSTDKTKEIIKDLELRISDSGFARFNLVESKLNLGVWPGQEKLLEYTNGKYVLGLCVDVIINGDFIKNAVEIMMRDLRIGALQAKIYKYDLDKLSTLNSQLSTDVIDTCGFKIFKSRRVVNIGHGEEDKGQYDNLGEIFGVEGACPFFRREAMEDAKIKGEIFDHDYFWYGDDFDFAWRINLFGWKQVFAPSVTAYHDRQTTKSLKKTWLDYILRVPVRHQIPIKKRRLDWRNTRFTIIKNDYIINILKDLPHIFKREAMVLGYTILFEPGVLLEIYNFLRLFPGMLHKRSEVMKKAKTSPKEMRRWFAG